MRPYHWYIELLGGLRVRQGDQEIVRFRTHKTGALLAYLACYLQRSHPREELIDIFWPEADESSGRASLRTALASLRRQLEPPGVPDGSLLMANRENVRLHPETVLTDLAEYESAIGSAALSKEPDQRAVHLSRAVALYRGPLLPGFYDDWAVSERDRVEQVYINALCQLAAAQAEIGRIDLAIATEERLVSAEPLMEEAHRELMRLYAASGQYTSVRRQYAELKRLLRREMNRVPSQVTKALLEKLLKEQTVASASSTTSKPMAELSLPAPPTESAPPPAVTQPSATTTPRLPMQLTRFFGREEEIGQILAMILNENEKGRLITLTGPGGSGKTRLAIEVAHRLTGLPCPDCPIKQWQVCFVALADITDARLIAGAVLDALRVRALPDSLPIEQIAHVLAETPTLLILDNFERLVEEGAAVVRDLLERIPTLICLLTSQQRLDIAGEHECIVSPLPVPDMPGTPARLSRYASIQLFTDRAQAVKPDFQLTSGNAAAVAALCERLEGIPLALELAAAWAQILTPAQMLARLARRFDLLTSRRKDLAPRHRTLRAAIEWGYRLLPAASQRLFAKLSVFRGDWTLDAAEQICREPEPPGQTAGTANTLELLYELQAHSLIVAKETGEEMRFCLLDALREYAGEQVSDEERAAIEARHILYFLHLVEEAEANLRGPEQIAWMDRLERETDNLRAALERCLERGEAEAGLRLAGALPDFWKAVGSGDEGLRWLEALLEKGATAPARWRAKALCGSAFLLQHRRADETLIERFEQSLRLYRDIGDRQGEASVLRKMSGPVFLRTRNPRPSIALLEESLAICQQADDLPGIADSLLSLGNLARDRGDYQSAESFYDRCLALYRQIEDMRGVATALAEMGYMLQARNDLDRAEDLLRENLALSRQLKDKHNTVHALWLLGRLAQDRGDYGAAVSLLEEGLAMARQTGSRQQVVNCLTNLGMVAGDQGDCQQARRFYAEVLALDREMGSRIGLSLPLWLDGHAAFCIGDYHEARLRYQERLSIAHEYASLSSVIHCLEAVARALQAEGLAERAARLFGAAEAAQETCPEPISHFDPTEYVCCVAETRLALGEEAFCQAWNEGRAMPLAEAIKEAQTP